VSNHKTVHIFGSCSQSQEQLLQNFDKGETAWLNELKGSWSLAFVQDEKVTLVTDRWGTRPIFYGFKNHEVVFSENIDDLTQELPQLTCNQQALARFLLEDFSHPEDTVFNEIKKVPQGCIVSIKNEKIQKAAWTKEKTWATQQNDFSRIVTDWSRELTQHLETLLPQHKKWGVFVSGGLDSAGLVALCTKLIQQNQWPVTLELYNLSSPDPESYDQGFCQKLAQEYGLPLHQICVTAEDLEKIYHRWHRTKSGLPFFPTLQMFEPLMKLAKKNQCTGLLFGYGADEQWTLPSATLAMDFLKRKQWSLLFQNRDSAEPTKTYFLSLLKLWAREKAPNILKSSLRRWSSRGIPWHLKNRLIFKDQQKQLKQRIQTVENNFTSTAQKQLYLRNFISGNNQHNLACHITLAQTLELKVYFPYLSPELLDISLCSSPELLLLAKDKQVLRNLLEGDLIEDIRMAPKFQDYSHLAHKTALHLAQPGTDFIWLQSWLRSDVQLVQFDSDSYFESLYVEKLMSTYGTGHEKEEKNLSTAEA
jgi:asparagine synthetase B (glutamine-hydrolysing)